MRASGDMRVNYRELKQTCMLTSGISNRGTGKVIYVTSGNMTVNYTEVASFCALYRCIKDRGVGKVVCATVRTRESNTICRGIDEIAYQWEYENAKV